MILSKEKVKSPVEYIIVLAKWLVAAAIAGAVGGVIGSIFHISIDYVTELRGENWWIILFLPLGGMVIALLYSLFSSKGAINTDRVLESARDSEAVPLIMAPLIFISTCITHLLGGSAGREGAALQLGGSIGYNLGRLFKMKSSDLHIIVMSGMSAVFSALFGTPLTAAFFALEVTCVGVIHYTGLIPCVTSAIVAYKIAGMFGLSPVRFENVAALAITAPNFIKVIILAILCAMVSILFCTAIHKTEHCMDKYLPNRYVRTLIGSGIILALTFCLQTFDYNGAGMNIITDAINGTARYESFILKIIFTALTIASGFKGGEIVPSFFIGSTFGCVVGGLLGIDAGFGAAVGFVALFCGVVNCPIASTILALEVFGADSILLMAIVCGVSYMMSGYFGLYKSQKIVYSKLNEDLIDRYTK